MGAGAFSSGSSLSCSFQGRLCLVVLGFPRGGLCLFFELRIDVPEWIFSAFTEIAHPEEFLILEIIGLLL